MEIKLHTNIDSVARVTNAPSKASRPIDAGTDLSVFDHSRALESRLKDVADVRPEKVEHARNLVAGPEYPPKETIKRIAALLAMKDSKSTQQTQE